MIPIFARYAHKSSLEKTDYKFMYGTAIKSKTWFFVLKQVVEKYFLIRVTLKFTYVFTMVRNLSHVLNVVKDSHLSEIKEIMKEGMHKKNLILAISAAKHTIGSIYCSRIFEQFIQIITKCKILLKKFLQKNWFYRVRTMTHRKQ